ncbi:hypothetical protein B0T22DRAFT_15664 [Podospora appendiculata]|uniref:non-specific serine/threonine protein kinase n=1 Tax=Podospora appendiculata TaxID=314037 RepID=A0AAE0XFT9_9PEZI|nr:hypothetical protein B0T22DRAFT_15664 [Podospora appendiculata]
MTRTSTVRKYGKPVRKTRAEQLFAELPKTPAKKPQSQPEPEPHTEPFTEARTETEAEIEPQSEPELGNNDRTQLTTAAPKDEITKIAEQLLAVTLAEDEPVLITPKKEKTRVIYTSPREVASRTPEPIPHSSPDQAGGAAQEAPQDLRVLTWDDVCPSGDKIEKIAEASYAEVYRVTNERGTSIIKVIRLKSPIKAQTKTQQRSGLVDEEPHSEDDLLGELQISEWLADVPGFVVYKERYVVQGKAPKALLETHQVFHRKMKRKDPDRLQFYPSPSRYLDDTRFLVVELGDAGTALEDFVLDSESQLWDIFLHTAIALARAEDLIQFEHRDLHEGNLCIRQARPAKPKADLGDDNPSQFGCSGLEITILDYGLSRAHVSPDDFDSSSSSSSSSRKSSAPTTPIAYDLEKDLSIFASTHAPQCKVYRQMRSFLLQLDRVHLPPESHTTPYAPSVSGAPISWTGHHPYTNVLWLSYIYQYLILHFKGDRKTLARFRRATKELVCHLDPEAPRQILSFPSAADVVRYAAEAGWITEDQLMGERSRVWDEEEKSVAYNESIIVEVVKAGEGDGASLRRSPRKAR